MDAQSNDVPALRQVWPYGQAVPDEDALLPPVRRSARNTGLPQQLPLLPSLLRGPRGVGEKLPGPEAALSKTTEAQRRHCRESTEDPGNHGRDASTQLPRQPTERSPPQPSWTRLPKPPARRSPPWPTWTRQLRRPMRRTQPQSLHQQQRRHHPRLRLQHLTRSSRTWSSCQESRCPA